MDKKLSDQKLDALLSATGSLTRIDPPDRLREKLVKAAISARAGERWLSPVVLLFWLVATAAVAAVFLSLESRIFSIIGFAVSRLLPDAVSRVVPGLKLIHFNWIALACALVFLAVYGGLDDVFSL